MFMSQVGGEIARSGMTRMKFPASAVRAAPCEARSEVAGAAGVGAGVGVEASALHEVREARSWAGGLGSQVKAWPHVSCHPPPGSLDYASSRPEAPLTGLHSSMMYYYDDGTGVQLYPVEEALLKDYIRRQM